MSDLNGDVSVSWAPPLSEVAVTGYALLIEGDFVGMLSTTVRQVAGNVGAVGP